LSRISLKNFILSLTNLLFLFRIKKIGGIMEKKWLILLFVLFVLSGCFRTPIAEVDVIAFEPLANYYSYDMISYHWSSVWDDEWRTYSSTMIAPDTFILHQLRYRLIIDSIAFIVRNKVDAMIRGYYINFYAEDDIDHPTFLYSSPYYALGPIIWGSDTTTYVIYNLPLPCWDASLYLENHPTLGSIRMEVVFYGEDIYNNRNFTASTHIGLYHAKK